MWAWYNEIDPYAAQWLRNLIADKLITDGEVDERPVQDVKPCDLTSFTRCHFFAGIAGWDLALRLADFPTDQKIWTGSCPCQGFSAAGKSLGFADERHLWPYWHHLIDQCRPPIILGEQVASKLALEWLDLVHADLESAGYSVGTADLCAAGVGAPHIRQRLWFVADMQVKRWDARRSSEASRRTPVEPPRYGDDRELADAQRRATERWRHDVAGTPRGASSEARKWERLRDDAGAGGEPFPVAHPGADDFWTPCDWLPCTDGKARPVGPGSFPLAHGVQRRASKLRAYGNAIVPQAAAEFVKAYLDCRP